MANTIPCSLVILMHVDFLVVHVLTDILNFQRKEKFHESKIFENIHHVLTVKQILKHKYEIQLTPLC